MSREASAEVPVHRLLFGEVDPGGLAVEADAADAAFLAEDGAADLVIAVGAGRSGGLGQAQGQLDPFVLHKRRLFFRKMQPMHDAVEHGGKDDAEEGDQDEATKKGVTCGEKLGGRIG